MLARAFQLSRRGVFGMIRLAESNRPTLEIVEACELKLLMDGGPKRLA